MSSFIVEGSRLPKWSVWCWVIAAAATLVPTFLFDERMALQLWGVFFACQAVAGLAWHPWRFRLEITDDGVVTSNGEKHAFEKLQAIVTPQNFVRSTKSQFPMNLVFVGGVVRIPSRISMSSWSLWELLRERRSQEASRRVASPLADFQRQQAETFGPERVWHCSGRDQLAWYPGDGGARAFGVGLVAAALIYFVMTAYGGDPGLAGFGAFALIMGLLFLAAGTGHFLQRKWGPTAYQNGVVVAPVGLAVSQGDLLGQISWNEIRSVRYPRRRGGIQVFGNDGLAGTVIQIGVGGAEIFLIDVYDRPLDEIYERILRNWQSPK